MEPLDEWVKKNPNAKKFKKDVKCHVDHFMVCDDNFEDEFEDDKKTLVRMIMISFRDAVAK